MSYREYDERDDRDRDRGCGCGGNGDVGGSSRNCVKDVVRRILDAQREISDEGSHDCDTSCDRSIDDLLSPSRSRRGRFTTIPFMLTCKHKCGAFYGSGFRGHGEDEQRRGHYRCIESPVFKIQGFIRGSNNCARLELLLPAYRHRDGEGDNNDSHHSACGGEVCNFFGHRRIENWKRTGVCITVNLDEFMGISCLDATTPREFED